MIRFSALELAAGHPLGVDSADSSVSVASAAAVGTARAVLDRILLEALSRPPCVIAFSGGRDSAALLAVAAGVAARYGLRPPVAATIRYGAHPASHEDRWQELVLDHLGHREVVVFDIADDHDVAGPPGRRLLRRHGLLWPPQVGSLAPLVGLARGGSLITGTGGDEVFGGGRWTGPPSDRSALRRAWRRSRRRAYRHAPRPVKEHFERRRVARNERPWLTARGHRVVRSQIAGWLAAEPFPYDEYLLWVARQRLIKLGEESVRVLGAAGGVSVSQPFLDERFLRAMGRSIGRTSPATRTAAMQRLFADVLPDDVLSRRSKADFSGAYMGPHTREAARQWDGEGIDHDLVDADRLRAEWLSEVPDFRSALLLQHVVASGHA